MSVISVDETITIAITVKDRHASAAWYQEMLGFELLFHADDAGWSELQTSTKGVTLGLGEGPEPQPGNATAVFGVADIDAARAALEAAGVSFEGDTMVIDGMVKLATFHDPDHNPLMIAQNLMPG